MIFGYGFTDVVLDCCCCVLVSVTGFRGANKEPSSWGLLTAYKACDVGLSFVGMR